MDVMKQDEIRQSVRRHYGNVAEGGGAACDSGQSCCGSSTVSVEKISLQLGYSADEVGTVPEGANLGLGCGNPQAIAALQPGEVVLDLGSGAGFDCFLAALQVGGSGQVIGVDMTPAMISKARANAEKAGHRNVDFRLGEIEHLPVADGTVDVILSNCVINLSPDKPQVFREAYRVLKPGGRLAISDVVAFAELPETVRQDMALYAGCIAGASPVAELETTLRECGFTDIRLTPKGESKSFMQEWAPGMDITEYVVSANIQAAKPTA